MQTNSFKWMLFATFFPVGLGLVVASIIFTLGTNFAWSGLEAMSYFYFSVVAITLILGIFPTKFINWKGGLQKS